jgi:hypothetical protein
LRYVAKSISSSTTVYSCCCAPLVPDGTGTARKGAWGSGRGGTMTGWR